MAWSFLFMFRAYQSLCLDWLVPRFSFMGTLIMSIPKKKSKRTDFYIS